MINANALTAQFPDKARILFIPKRYKVLYGGRGSGKSHSIAKYLLLIGITEKHRVLCTREVQKSIRDSVKRLLEDQIEEMGLSGFYQSFESEIRGKNGTLFIFNGLSTETTDSLKSLEKITKVWCEEAASISKRSWDILTPTIRADDSEILISFNPDLETDETYQRFIVRPPEDCISAEMNHRDNPWFPPVLEAERLRCKERDPDNYDNIWEGKCRPAVEGAIYYKEVERAQSNGQIMPLPYDPMLKVHVVVDLGWNDQMSIALVQRQQSSIRVIDYIEDSHRTIDSYSAELKGKQLNWGKVWLPHDGFSGDVKTGKTCEAIFRSLGWDVAKKDDIVQLSVEDGIKNARMSFHRVYFDQHKTERLVECLKRYRRKVSRATNEESTPVHDEYSHGADCFRYVCCNADQMHNEEQKRRPIIPGYGVLDAVIGY